MTQHTPWGYADHSEQAAIGIHWHSTPSHGGFFLTPDKNKLVPLNVRRATFNGQGLRGWYEEDVDWSIVVRFFPEHFTAAQRDSARSTFESWIAPKLPAMSDCANLGVRPCDCGQCREAR